LIVRRTNKHVIAQVATYDPSGDKILTSAHTRELTNFGYTLGTNNMSANYLLGLLAGVRITSTKIPLVIADFGLQHVTHKGNLYAFLKGVHDAGVPIPVREDFFPDPGRISGNHIEAYAKTASGTTFAKTKQDAQKATAIFAKAKESILHSNGASTTATTSSKKTTPTHHRTTNKPDRE